MCGIFGQLELRPNAPGREGLLTRASGRLRHRGPDGAGTFVDAYCALGHTRLKVIDPSPAAMQPMRSSSGRSAITYNGELFNYLELRAQLDVPVGGFRSSSDTEVLLEALEQRGLDALRSFNGMFAIAWWRPEERELVLIRDRLGKKPLYWTRLPGGALRFGSEISAVLCDGTRPRTSTDRIAEFLQYGYNLGPRTSFSDVESVPPGHFLRAKVRDDRIDISIERYWALPPYEPSQPSDFRAWVDELDATLSNSVKIRLRADVPLGIFLSGGIDSSVVALLASRELGSGLRTMTVDFAEKEFSEAAYAEEVAQTLKADHRRVEADAPTVDDVANIVATYGELHGDVSALASAHPGFGWV